MLRFRKKRGVGGRLSKGIPGDDSLASGAGSLSRLKLHQDDQLFQHGVLLHFACKKKQG